MWHVRLRVQPRSIVDPVDGEVLEVALGQAFVPVDQTDWKLYLLLYCPLGFRVLLWSGLLQVMADVILRFARQAQPFTGGGVQCGPNL
jgi:hypothetical protein